MNEPCPSCLQPIDDEVSAQEAQATRTRDSDTSQCATCGRELLNDVEASATREFTHTMTASGRIANFSLVRQLGEGSFGEVWLAQDQSLGRQVALKLPRARVQDAKLLHEAQTAARLRHPNIVSIYEVGVDDDQIFIASEYVDGDDLRDILAHGRPPIQDGIRLVMSIARAVEHAHQQGVVHRDLKPANIILNRDGEPFVTDFGIAKHLSDEETISTDGQVVGTVSYMSPEQAQGRTKETDSRSDIYAIGVILFEILTEFRPFRGNARAVMHQKIYEDPPSPRKLVPSLPKDLATICLKCLERDPAKRYSTAAEVADELERFQQSIPITARPISRLEKGWRWCRRQPVIAVLIASLFLSLTSGLLGTTLFWSQASNQARQTQASLYRTRMNLAGKLWERGDIDGLRKLLSHYPIVATSNRLPPAQADRFDPRKLEWFYYSALLEPFTQTVHYQDVVTDVAISHDGRFFAATGLDRSVRVWQSKTGDEVRTIPLPAQATCLLFHPLDDRLMVTGTDGIVRFWNPANHDREIMQFRHGPGLHQMAVSPDGRLLATVGRQGTTRVWQISSREPIAEISESREPIQAIRFSPNSTLLALAKKNGKVVLWNLADEQAEFEFTVSALPLSLAFVEEPPSLAVGTYAARIEYWSWQQQERLLTARLDAAVGDLEYLPKLGALAAVTTGNRLRILNERAEVLRSVVTHTLTHGMLARSADGSSLVAGSGDGTVKLLSTESLGKADIAWLDTHVRDVAFVGARGQVAACAGDGSVRLWDPKSNELQTLLPSSGREMLAIAAQPGGSLLACCGMEKELQILDVAQAARIQTISLPQRGFASVTFSPDASLLAAGSRNGTLLLYDVDDWKAPVLIHETPAEQITDICFTPDSQSLVVAYASGRLLLLDAFGSAADAPDALTAEVPGTPLALTFCDTTGTRLAVGTQAGEIRIYETPGLKLIEVWKAHSSRINALAISPGGRRLISGGRDRELRVWDVSTGELVTSLPGHGRQVFAIDVTADGEDVVSAGLAGDIRLWHAPRSTAQSK